MVNINAITNWNPINNGNYKIYISVCHNGQRVRFATDMEIPARNNLKNNRVVKCPNAEFLSMKLSTLIRQYEEKLIGVDVNRLTCREIVDLLKKPLSSSHTILSVLDEYLLTIEKKRSKDMYSLSIRRFSNFLGEKTPIALITTTDIQRFHNRLVDEKISPTTINIYMTHVKIIINYAIKIKYVSYSVHPFEVYKKPKKNIREVDITVEEIKRIRDVELSKHNLMVVRDIFMLSYYLCGMNIVDVLNYNFKGKKQVQYVRTKTSHTKNGNNRTIFTIQPEAKAIIDKYINKSGFLVFSKYNTQTKISNLFEHQLGNLAMAANVKKRVIYYTARKSFVQHGFELGIPLETLEYCIGQSMKTNRPIFNYVKIMSKHADLAIRQILDNLK